MTYNLEVVGRYLPFLLRGIKVTLQFTVLGFGLGSILGLLLALGRFTGTRAVRLPCLWYVNFVRGTPLLAQVYLIHFGLPQIFKYRPIGSVDAMIALSLNSAAYIAEIWRGGIESMDKGQMEAARSLGMTHWQAMRYVILPQAFRRVIPSMGNEFIALLKESSLVSIIGMEDLMMKANMMAGHSFRPFEAYFTVALIYLVLTLTFTQMMSRLERGLSSGRD